MTRWLYSLAMWMVQPLLRFKLMRRAQAESEYGEHIDERFGYYAEPFPVLAPGQFWLWVHAVSLGETRAAAVLIDQLRLQMPQMRLLLTHGTATGRLQGRTLLRPGDVQVWQPWDAEAPVRRFLAHFKPRAGLLMETEVWPNLAAQCAQAGVPLCLVNARLSEKSLKQAQRLVWLARPAYAALAAVWAQTDDDAQRLLQLGAPVKGVMGNFKFDAAPDATQLARGLFMRSKLDKPVLMFASSREGEEQLLIDKFKQKQLLAPVDAAQVAMNIVVSGVQWLVVPRHPQRFDAVAELFMDAGFSVSRRSQWSEAVPEAADVWLGDTVGEMALYYGMSDLALLGGSFAPLGGQNLIEATACGCPVVMGPHTFNFAQASALASAAGAAFVTTGLAPAVDAALALLQSPDALSRARHAALAWGAAHQGAAQRTAAAVKTLLLL